MIGGVTKLSIESESNKQELNVQQNSLNSAYKTESIIVTSSSYSYLMPLSASTAYYTKNPTHVQHNSSCCAPNTGLGVSRFLPKR